MKRIISIVIILMFAFSLVACGSEKSTINTQTNAEIETKAVTKSARDSLSESERTIYYAIRDKLRDFKSPASVKLISVFKGKDYFHDGPDVYYVTISAQNSFGGAVTTPYYVYHSSLETCGSNLPLDAKNVYDVSVSKINSAIDEYKAQNGWS